ITVDLERYRIRPGESVDLATRATDDTQGLSDSDEVDDQFDEHLDALDDLQERLYAQGSQSLLFVFQAMDAGGKDSSIRKVFGPLNPQGVRVWSFKVPSKKEAAHDYLWRIHRRAPGDGYIGVFNRSHYEAVLVEKVLDLAPADRVAKRYTQINDFERLLSDEGTTVVKVMLHISKAYQLERFKRRLRKPDKFWKFNPSDLDTRALWDDYMAAFEVALSRCSTVHAPWYVIPAENRWFRNLALAQLVRETLERMDPQFPPPDFDPAAYPPDSLV
ncbi:MAG: PPK2 family polyphosphate kinase, partial [Bacteroidota bacterium]